MALGAPRNTRTFVAAIAALYCFTPATLRAGAPKPWPNEKWVVTPDTMHERKLSIEARFTPHTSTRGGETKKTGIVAVKFGFDAERGPAINRVDFARLYVTDGEEVLANVPILAGRNPDTNKIAWLSFSLRNELMRHTYVLLEYRDGFHGFYYVLPVESFRETAE